MANAMDRYYNVDPAVHGKPAGAAKPGAPAAPPATEDATTLGKWLAAAASQDANAPRRGMLATLPVFGEVWIELAGHEDVSDIEAATFAHLRGKGLELETATALSYEDERSMRTLAIAVRDAKDRGRAFGTLEQWRKVDSDLVKACSWVYDDVRRTLDVLAPNVLTDEQARLIQLAIEKKNQPFLMSCGVGMLAIYLLTTESRQASSPTPPSSTGPSAPE